MLVGGCSPDAPFPPSGTPPTKNWVGLLVAFFTQVMRHTNFFLGPKMGVHRLGAQMFFCLCACLVPYQNRHSHGQYVGGSFQQMLLYVTSCMRIRSWIIFVTCLRISCRSNPSLWFEVGLDLHFRRNNFQVETLTLTGWFLFESDMSLSNSNDKLAAIDQT